MEKVLELTNINKKYGPVWAVQNLSLTVEKGQIWGILGPNGSGKTTTLAIILGIIYQDSGEFSWFDEPVNTPINRFVGSLLETPNFYPYLNLLQNLKIAAEIKQLEINDDAEFERVLKLVHLYKRRTSKYVTLSLGMKQRLALASLLLGDPQVLVLDEPTNGLDPEGIAEVREIIINEAKKGKTIILASHILDEVEKVCTHVGILKHGKLLAKAKVSELSKPEDTVIVSAENVSKLYELLARSGMYKQIEQKGNDIYLILKEEFTPANINEYAFKNEIILSKFEVKKKSLETQFLEITSQKA